VIAKLRTVQIVLSLLLLCACVVPAAARDNRLEVKHWFDFEEVSDPQISPDGERVVYVRRYTDIMKDSRYSSLWMVNTDGTRHRPITTGKFSDRSPRWSHDGTRIAFVSDREEGSKIFVHFVDDGQLVQVTNTPKSASAIAWSPDDTQIAFTIPVEAEPPEGVKMPKKPKGAQWADPPVVIEKVNYRSNARGYLPDEYRHIFVVPALGGTPRQLTDGDYDHGAPSWSADGSKVYFSATRKPEAEWVVQDSEIYSVTMDGTIEALTDRRGPDRDPIVSPRGSWIAYTGFDEKEFAYTITRLYVMRADGTEVKCLTPELDRDVSDVVWCPGGAHVYVTIRDRGLQNVHRVGLDGQMAEVTEGVHQIRGITAAPNGRLAGVLTNPTLPGDVVTFTTSSGNPLRLTNVNDDLLDHREIGSLEEIWYESSLDGRKVQGWILKPPAFDPSRKYPLILYIHGGPHAMYSVRFSFEFQVLAAEDYVVFYCNPRGSTGYGEEFGNIIQYKYPGDDYHDLMSGVGDVVKRGYIDERNLFVTGGSGGGVLTCWIIGQTDRFAAAVSQYPVINWYSFVLTCDITGYVAKRWFRGFPWEEMENHMARSPISLVGNVTTPTLLITGEADWRTPISETEQYYQALRIQKKEAKLVRVPDEAHGVHARPSHYIAKILHIREWFELHKRTDGKGNEETAEKEGT